MRIAAVAKQLGVSSDSLRRLERAGVLPPTRRRRGQPRGQRGCAVTKLHILGFFNMHSRALGDKTTGCETQ